MDWEIGGKTLRSHLFLGTAQYPSPEILVQALEASGTHVATVSLRRQSPDSQGGRKFWDLLRTLDIHLLPNTAGCRTVREAVTTAHMARELFGVNWIKLEIIGDDFTLQPDPFGLVEAADILIREGFEVFPYMTEDFIVAKRLIDVGCSILMPWVAPIGTGKGALNLYALRLLRERLPDVRLIADAGLGLPSHAAQIMELGYDGVLLNSAVALSEDPVSMASAFAMAVNAGFLANRAGPMPPRDMAAPSTPVIGMPFWHQSSACTERAG